MMSGHSFISKQTNLIWFDKRDKFLILIFYIIIYSVIFIQREIIIIIVLKIVLFKNMKEFNFDILLI